MEMTRTVTSKSADPWNHEYRCRIEEARPTLFRRIPRWEVVVESYFVHWKEHHTFGKFLSPKDAEAAANRWMDDTERPAHYVKERTETP